MLPIILEEFREYASILRRKTKWSQQLAGLTLKYYDLDRSGNIPETLITNWLYSLNSPASSVTSGRFSPFIDVNPP